MEFDQFLGYLPKILNHPLPAIAAHAKMAPAGRAESLLPEFYANKNARNSAVMMLCYPKDNLTHLVLIRRNTYPGIHSAQISFPGGKVEAADKDLAHTALRETFEEIGIAQDKVNIVKAFSSLYIPPSNFLVFPFLGIATQPVRFLPNPAEVEQVIELPLHVLLDDSTITAVEIATSYAQKISVPAFIVQGHIVWGATAMILSELKETIKSVLI